MTYIPNYTDKRLGDLSKKACKAHMCSAARRGIKFCFTYETWLAWWLEELEKLGPDARRGRRSDQYVMARRGDAGDYEIGNVFPMRPIQNAADRPLTAKQASIAKSRETRGANGVPLGAHLKVRGDGHPKSKAVWTEDGRFGSLALAAEHFGITRQGAGHRVRIGRWACDVD